MKSAILLYEECNPPVWVSYSLVCGACFVLMQPRWLCFSFREVCWITFKYKATEINSKKYYEPSFWLILPFRWYRSKAPSEVSSRPCSKLARHRCRRDVVLASASARALSRCILLVFWFLCMIMLTYLANQITACGRLLQALSFLICKVRGSAIANAFGR